MGAGIAPADAPAPDSQVFVDRALGSRLQLSLTGVGVTAAQEAWRAVQEEFSAADVALSGFRPESAISVLNGRAGDGLVAVERRLYHAAALADRAWRATEGRFDPRVHVVLRRLDHPAARGIRTALPTAVGTAAPWLLRRPRERRLAISEPIDLHGLGKGLALRWAWHAAERSLPADAGGLLDAGGDLIGRAPGPDGEPWLIGIEDPRGGADPVAVLALARGAVCTSSTRVSRWMDPAGVERHHLIDPVSAAPADGGLTSVTVAGIDAAWCEIRTKELFVLGREAIAHRARQLGLAAWWTTDDESLEMTPLARLVTRWP